MKNIVIIISNKVGDIMYNWCPVGFNDVRWCVLCPNLPSNIIIVHMHALMQYTLTGSDKPKKISYIYQFGNIIVFQKLLMIHENLLLSLYMQYNYILILMFGHFRQFSILGYIVHSGS